MTFCVEVETDVSTGLDYQKILEMVAEKTLDMEGCPYEAMVNLLITDDEGIHEINKEQRDIDRATDVLSFPMHEYENPADFDELEEDFASFEPDSGELMLGDIVISAEHVLAQAESYGHSVLREFAFLIAHSMLHLIGYDHMVEEEAEDMFARQEAVLEALGIGR